MIVRYCISPSKRRTMMAKYKDWPSKQHTRIPVKDVGRFPIHGGTEDYVHNLDSADDEEWYEYHVDWLPEELAQTLNGNRGGYVSQRSVVYLSRSAPRLDDTAGLVERLSDLLVVSDPNTRDVLQRQVDRSLVGQKVKKQFTTGEGPRRKTEWLLYWSLPASYK